MGLEDIVDKWDKMEKLTGLLITSHPPDVTSEKGHLVNIFGKDERWKKL